MRKPDAQHGFTLLEVLIAMTIFSVVMVGAMTLFSSNQDAYRRGQLRAEIQQNARVALQMASREIRSAGYDVSGVMAGLTSPTAIQVANSNRLTFVADVTGDGVLNQVTYRRQGSQLIREFSSWTGSAFSSPASGEVADGIGLLTFAYFDDTTPTNNSIAAPVGSSNLDDIRRVTVSVVTSDAAIDFTESYPLILDVKIRN